MQSTLDCVDRVKNAPAYEHIKYSKSTFFSFAECSKTIFEGCISKLDILFDDFSEELASLVSDTFKHILETAHCIFDHKLQEFYKIMSKTLISFRNISLVIFNIF